MPNRILRDGINASNRVNRLSLGAEVLYRRLMSVADDYGRFHASPETIRGACWPTCPNKVAHQEVVSWLQECCAGERPLVVLYRVEESIYLYLADFNQKPRSKSKFPQPADKVQSICPQPADKMPALDVVRNRSSESYSHPLGEEAAGLPLVCQHEYPLTLAECRKKDPATSERFVLTLVEITVRNLQGTPKFPKDRIEAATTDKVISRACAESFATGPRDHGLGLLQHRVPDLIVAWGTEKKTNGR